jgi:hypothetical protein
MQSMRTTSEVPVSEKASHGGQQGKGSTIEESDLVRQHSESLGFQESV